ncbi:hypothetical protein JCM15765_18000 [Paradesulfitobacterium aromaticivorans]
MLKDARCKKRLHTQHTPIAGKVVAIDQKNSYEQPTISKGSKEVLQPGMVVAIEPKLVFPGLGAVGVEDTVVVEGQEGARYLCPVPREIVII